MCLFFCIVRYCMVIIDRARHSKRTSCRPSGVRLYYRIVTNRTACNLSLSAFHSLTISSSLPVLSSSSSLPLFFTSCCLSPFLFLPLPPPLPPQFFWESLQESKAILPCARASSYCHAVGGQRLFSSSSFLSPLSPFSLEIPRPVVRLAASLSPFSPLSSLRGLPRNDSLRSTILRSLSLVLCLVAVLYVPC